MRKPRLSRGPRRLYRPKPISMPRPPAPAAPPVPEPAPAWDPFPVPPADPIDKVRDASDRLAHITKMVTDMGVMIPEVIASAVTRGEKQARAAAADALPPLTRLDGPEGAQFVRLATVDCISNPILLEPKGMTKMKVVRYLTLQSGAKVMVLDTLHNRTVLQLAGENTAPEKASDLEDDDD